VLLINCIYTRQTQEQQRFTISEVAVDWHELSSSSNSHTSNETAVPEQTIHWRNVWMD